MKKVNRVSESISHFFTSDLEKAQNLFLLASCDKGVRRNYGRAGARFAPEAIINNFKKFANTTDFHFAKFEVSAPNEKFEVAQKEQTKNITPFIHNQKNLIHIGGGHDHVYPFLMAFNEAPEKNIVIINIDAHLDTRVDDEHHSGTPFRNIDTDLDKNITLIQYGIHDFANSRSTKTDLVKTKQHVLSFEKLKTITNFFTRLPDEILTKFLVQEDTIVIISLDVDAIEAGSMPAVSAVNPEGIPLGHIADLINYTARTSYKCHLGIYEYNPIFDDLSQKGSRAIASLIHGFVKNR